MKTQCPFCHRFFEVDSSALSEEVVCPSCNKPFAISKYDGEKEAQFEKVLRKEYEVTTSDTLESDLDKTIVGYRGRRERGEVAVGDLVLRRYKILQELGSGAMGMVFLCQDQVSGVDFALKMVPPELARDAEAMEGIRTNFQLIHNLKHPNIASVDFLERDEYGRYFLLMEFAQGRSLAAWRRAKGGIVPLEDLLPVIEQIASALDYAHAKGVLHRDVKPANVMISDAGEVKILDFGLASSVRSSLTNLSINPANSSGTPNYMPPESFKAQYPRPASDQYSFAVMVYEMLAGHLPFNTDNFEMLRTAVINEEPEPLENVSDSVNAVLRKALAKSSKERFASCLDFVSALSEEKVAGPGRNTQGNRKLFWIMGVAVAVVALLAGIFVFVKSEDTSERTSLRPAPEAKTEVKKAPAFETRPATANPAKVEFNGAVTLPGNVEMKLIKVESGSFLMGSPADESDRCRDETQHRVTLTKPFWIGKYEVTQAQYEAVMGNNPSKFKGPNRPVEQVSWDDAMAFCEKLNELPEVKRPAGYKFSLPTEAQWEYACRAGTTGKYAGNLDSMGWYVDNSGTHDVGQKRPNAWGVYDMHGNVWEWCRDWHEYYTVVATSPSGPLSGSGRVNRGGGWSSIAGYCRSANRDSDDPGLRSSNLGFRVALVPVQ